MIPFVEKGEMDWQSRAVCAGQEPSLFDPMTAGNSTRPGASDRVRLRAAKKICGECPVRDACLLFGTQQKYSGVFGGQYLSNGHIVATHEPAYQGPPRAPRKKRRAA